MTNDLDPLALETQAALGSDLHYMADYTQQSTETGVVTRCGLVVALGDTVSGGARTWRKDCHTCRASYDLQVLCPRIR